MGKLFLRDENGAVTGVFILEGDEPNEQETQALIQFTGDLEGRTVESPIGDPRFKSPEIPEPVVPSGIGLSTEDAPLSRPRQGPLGLVPVETRMGIRRAVEKQGSLVQLVTEMSPSAAGTGVGATLGGIATGGNPLGIIGGGTLGGVLMELLAQETGIAPESELNLALAGGGPLAGPVVGGGLRLGKRGASIAFTKGFPSARVARARNVMGRAVSEFESIGATILNKSAGAGKTASEIYRAASRAKARIRPEQLNATREEIAKLVKKLTPMSDLDTVGGALKALEKVSKTMLNNPKGILLEEFVEARSNIGAIIGVLDKAGAKGGLKLNVSKKVFSVMSDDLDKIARGTAVVGSKARSARQARLFQEGISRAKLQFAVQRLENKVAQFTQRNVKGVPPNGVLINFKSLSKWIDDATNLKSAKFDKNFTEVLKDHLPELKKRIAQLAEMSATSSPGGPGSIVLRGQSAKIGRALVGGAFGFVGAGPVGAALGGLAFAQGPEMLVAILTTKGGAAFLEAAAKAGKGTINMRTWMVASEIAFRSLGETGKAVHVPPGGPKSSSVGPVTIDTPTTLREEAKRGEGQTGLKTKPKAKPAKTVDEPKGTSAGAVTIPNRTRKRLPADFEVGP